MPLADAVPAFQAAFDAEMIDTVTVVNPATRGTLNTTDLQYTGGTSPTAYTGPALIRPKTGTIGDPDVVGQTAIQQFDYVVILPIAAAGITLDDQVTIDVCTHDADLVGKVLIVLGMERDSFGARRQLFCELNQGTGVQD